MNNCNRFSLLIFQLLLFLGFGVDPLWGINPATPVERLLNAQWMLNDGLPSDIINAIAQAADGYLWIGTNNGLVRFDGRSFQVIDITRKEKGGVGGDDRQQRIADIYVDTGDNLWIALQQGLMRYGRDDNTGVRHFRFFPSFPGEQGDRRFSRLYGDSSGSLWLGTADDYLGRLDKGRFTRYDGTSGLGGKFITGIVEDAHGFLWVTTLINGLYRFQHGRFAKVDVHGLTPRHSLHAISKDRRGNLWLGTNMGLFQCRGEVVRGYTTSEGLTDNRISTILEDSSGNLWVGTVNGLNRIIETTPGKQIVEHCLAGFCINCLFEDREKSLWVGTNGSGLRQLKEGVFTSYSRKNGLTNFISSLHEGKDGKLWIATDYGQLYYFQDGKITEFPIPKDILDLRIRTLGEDSAGNILVGTIRDGIFRVGRDALEPFRKEIVPMLSGSIIQAIRCDRYGRTWVGTMGKGLFLLPRNISQARNYTIGDGLASNVITGIYEDKGQDTWIATSAGLNRLPGGRFEKIETYLPGVFVLSVYRDQAGFVWVCTLGKGLTCFKTGTLPNGQVASSTRFLTAGQGLGTNNIFQILEDEREHFWLSSDAGVLEISRRELELFFSGTPPLETVNCMIYGLSDGLESVEINAWGQDGSLATTQGDFWFATKKGVSVVTPSALTIDKLPAPPVVIEKISVNGKTLNIGKHGGKSGPGSLVFTDSDDLRVFFTAPTFIAQERIKFRYQLRGFDSRWQELAPLQPRVVTYRNLPVGEYRFWVTACGSDGVWNEAGVDFEFLVKRAFPLKLALLILAIVLVVVGLLVGHYLKRRATVVSHEGTTGLAAGSPGERDSKIVKIDERKMERETKATQDEEKQEVEGVGEDTGVEPERKKYRTSALGEVQLEKYAREIISLFDIQKVYRDEKISVKTLSDRLGIPSHQLSQVINEKLQKNFFDLVNSYRIEEAKQRLIDPGEEGRSILAIAYDVGYSTKAVFNRVFKKYTGMTPSQYRKKKNTPHGGAL